MHKILFFLIITLMFSCKKSSDSSADANATGTFVFYKMSATSGNWDVLVDGTDKGLVPFTGYIPDCNSSDGLKVTVSAGKHSIDFKSLDGYAWGDPVNVTIKADECKPYTP